MPTELLTPVLEGGIRHVNFFNGRLLTAEDLRDEQQSGQKQLRDLGQALGEGVVSGLQVEKDPVAASGARVTITPGTALNRKGDMLRLPTQISLELVPRETRQAAGNGDFIECSPATSATPTGTGVYVLVMSPASQLQDRAPKVGLKDNGVSRRCGSRYQVEGVQFRLIFLDADSDVLLPAGLQTPVRNLLQKTTLTRAEESKLRNLLAHWCLGTVERKSFTGDLMAYLPGGQQAIQYGPLDKIRRTGADQPQRLTGCDVPLSLIFWTGGAIGFVDMWSIRRRVHSAPASYAPPFPLDDRVHAENEAAFLQFQQQVAWLTAPNVSQIQLSTVRAQDYFHYLPSLGCIPYSTSPATRGFDYLKFFQGLTYRDRVIIEGIRLQSLLRFSLDCAPLAIESPQESEQLWWLYGIRENAALPGTGGNAVTHYLVFASGYIPYAGEAQYNLSRWNFSNYSPGVSFEPRGE